ncbi:bifunctional methylenetetrahydrofolate dehydrogenase/methenyltetrahydrofolate cyclohydrolase [Candidatus Falkowbacteria bacterium]|nr:bifunctional methylenetetrahydrofolate dehydrogenase/methenyltetrahydrofolate cyclohydrolase [Candidatus Falkowbacteria bacterium]
MKIIDGKKIAEKIKDEIVAEIINIKGGYSCPTERPNLAILLVGDRKDSELYVELKEKEAKKVGIDTHLYKFSENDDQKDIEKTIEFLNKDEEIDAILLQLPLPSKFDTDKLIESIDPEKDVDRFHPENLNRLSLGCNLKHDLVPPLIQVILEIFLSIDFNPQGKLVCAVVNSDIFGQSLKKTLECQGARVEICKADDDLKNELDQADVIISAVGRPGVIKAEYIKKGVCLIDIGITKNKDGKVLGDADFKNIGDKVGYITPVPGGVGPITIATALRNTLNLYKKNKCK